MTKSTLIRVKRVHAGFYTSAPQRWTFRKNRNGWFIEENGKTLFETLPTLKAARQRAADIEAERAAVDRPSTAPTVERLRIERVREHADHFKAVDERGRVMSTGPLAMVGDAVTKHWPFAQVTTLILLALLASGCSLGDVPEPCPFTVTEDHVVHERTWVRAYPKTWGETPDGELVECYWRTRNTHGVSIPSGWYAR